VVRVFSLVLSCHLPSLYVHAHTSVSFGLRVGVKASVLTMAVEAAWATGSAM
jgi:hypothetical protein